MTEASVSFAGNLTDDPEVRYTEGAIDRLGVRSECTTRSLFPGPPYSIRSAI